MPIPRFILFVLLIFSIKITAANVIITGSNKAYANSEIAFFKTSNLVVNEDIQLAKTTADQEGKFSLSIDITQTTYIFSYLGVYKCFIYIEPGKKYALLLPPKKEMTEADKFNPYFEHSPVHLFCENTTEDDLNFCIRSFDDSWVPYYNRFAQNIYSRNSRNMFDTAIASLNRPYLNINNEYFKTYKDYKIGLLRHLAYQQKSKSVWKQYFYKRPIEFENPGYCDLFNQVFDKYFLYFSLSPQGKTLPEAINGSKSLWKLMSVLGLDSILQNDSLKELVILKNLHDEFYKANHSRSAMLIILDSLIASTPVQLHKSIGMEIKNKVTRLMAGFYPPTINLSDINGKKYTLDDFKGKYLYLCFCSCNSYSCLKEFDALQSIQNIHQNRLNIVTILVDTDTSEIRNFLTKSEFKWVFLISKNQPEIQKEYDIRAYPTYYFIGRDSKLIWSPAPAPGEGFEIKWFEYLRDKKDL